MTSERWAHVKTLFESALEQPPEQRSEFLLATCKEDESLIAEVRDLLHWYEQSQNFMTAPMTAAVATRKPIDTDSLEGTHAGPWKLLHRVGMGGMAVVYAAARGDEQFHKKAAVKIVKPGMDTHEILARFRTEREVLASLEHPNIARLLDGGTTDAGLPYLVMEYVEGVPIDRYCDSHGLSIVERLQLFRTVCSAVQYAHQNLVVHRDLKPGNILVTDNGTAKLLDFGIAKLLGPGNFAGTAMLTRADIRPMTPQYASPEQVRGESITTATDIYALGVLLYELLTGALPYRLRGVTQREMEHTVCDVEPAPPSAAQIEDGPVVLSAGGAERLRRRLRGDLDVIVLTALRKEPQRRYPSVERLSHDVDLHLRGAPITARKDTWRYRTGKFLRRHTAGVLVAASIAAALIGSTAVSVHFATVAGKQKQMTLELVGFMSELDTAMQSGLTSARQKAQIRIVDTIQALSPNAAADPKLRNLLINAYLKIGDLQGNVYESNLGDAAAARQSYQKALELATAPGFETDLALTKLKLADIAFGTGDRKGAQKQYLQLRDELETAVRNHPEDTNLRQSLARMWYRLGLTQSQLGDLSGALASYRQELTRTEELAEVPGARWQQRRRPALAEWHVADMLVQNGNPKEAEQHIRRALEMISKLRQANPANETLRGDYAALTVADGEAFKGSGDYGQAEERLRASLQMLETLVAQDPNAQYQSYQNRARNALAEVLAKRGKMAESKQVTQALLADLRPVVEKPGASPFDLYEYLWAVFSTPFGEFRNPPLDIKLAQHAVESTHSSDPGLLDMLALASEENGDLGQAIASERQALALLKPNPGPKRAQIVSNLARFERELARGAAPPKRSQQ